MCFALAGCETNPLPQQGEITANRPAPPRVVTPPLVIDVPTRLIFREGIENSYTLRMSVPAPGSPVVEVIGLPAGATFDPMTFKLTWTPGYNAAGDATDPGEVDRDYSIRLLLKSSLDSVTFVERSIVITVKDVLRPLTVSSDRMTMATTEGTALVHRIKIKSLDFPSGPFTLYTDGLPAGATIAPGSTPDEFIFGYTPGYGVVNSDQYGPMSLVIKVDAVGPRNTRVRQELKWEISHKQREPVTSMPETLTVVDSVVIAVNAVDSNEERPPTISFADAVPGKGRLRIETREIPSTDPGILPRTEAMIFWDTLPAAEFGRPQTLNLKFCVKGYSREECLNRAMVVTFSGRRPLVDLVDRREWPLDQIRYFRVSDELATPVLGGRVQIDPRESDNVSFAEVRDGQARVRATGPGPGKIMLRVQSANGSVQREPFIFRAVADSGNAQLHPDDRMPWTLTWDAR